MVPQETELPMEAEDGSSIPGIQKVEAHQLPQAVP